MNGLPDVYQRFQQAILSNSTDFAAADIICGKNLSAEDGLRIYIDGYRLRLKQAVAADYPALLSYLGDNLFDKLAGAFIEQTPPTHFNLDRYAFPFAAYLQKCTPDIFTQEIAVLEQAIAESFMAEESQALSVVDVNADLFDQLKFMPRHSGRLLTFTHNVNAWLTQQRQGLTSIPPQATPSYTYVYRHNNEVLRAELFENEFKLLATLFNGVPVGEALNTQTHLTDAEVQHYFAKWFAQGYFRKTA